MDERDLLRRYASAAHVLCTHVDEKGGGCSSCELSYGAGMCHLADLEDGVMSVGIDPIDALDMYGMEAK